MQLQLQFQVESDAREQGRRNLSAKRTQWHACQQQGSDIDASESASPWCCCVAPVALPMATIITVRTALGIDYIIAQWQETATNGQKFGHPASAPRGSGSRKLPRTAILRLPASS